MLKRLCDVETQEDLLSLDATKLEAAYKKKAVAKESARSEMSSEKIKRRSSRYKLRYMFKWCRS